MNDTLRTKLGVPFPLFAFSHCRDVIVAVSKAGGFGVLGAAGFSPDELETELTWIDQHIDGHPYGVDLLFPENMALAGEDPSRVTDLARGIPQQHRQFVADLLKTHGVDPGGEADAVRVSRPPSLLRAQGVALLDVAFRHPIKLIVNALGLPPKEMFEGARAKGVLVGALAGAREHALRHVEAGVDVIVAQGGEAGGHCGEVSTMVLIPEVVRAVRAVSDVPVLAAGGIMTGRQMAAAMVLGASGAWTGSVWLATTESETSEIFRDKMVKARSRDTVRSKGRTGKYSRQLKSAWTDAWEGPDSPGALPMPLQSMISEPALQKATAAAERGVAGGRELVTYFVGQGVGLVENVRSARAVVQDFREEFAEALGDLDTLAS
ncbi:NAD(P)H-dependent flavin oxidoreductase [Chelatococcus reniformis]|uniref:Monooxygenase n=1 Tax=Chelatococcus reniformis TaxID=1494448 RepID=A0A916UT99_9HYPH|nr:nitronate monooxygenase [Chelatococcus reniformis]GGC87353.1 monooxygenase [Chelatococcus reniformis]